jgi:hypothetical protein
VKWHEGRDGRTNLARIEHAPALDLFPCHHLQDSPNSLCRRIVVVERILGHCPAVSPCIHQFTTRTHRASPRALCARQVVPGQDRIYHDVGVIHKTRPTHLRMDVTKRAPSVCTNSDGSIWNTKHGKRQEGRGEQPGRLYVIDHNGPRDISLSQRTKPSKPIYVT